MAFFLSSNFCIFPVEVFGNSPNITYFGLLNPAIFSLQKRIISSSVEVENVVAKHPAVSLVAVVAKPDEKWGETPCAFVELAPGKEASSDEIISFCKENMAGFKRPKYVIFGELPKTSTGKIQKFELRKKAKEI